MATFNKQQAYNIVVHRNLFCRVRVRILTFCANCISDSYSAIHTVHYTNTQTNNLPRKLLCQCHNFHWNLKTVEHIYWSVVSSSSLLTADRWCAVMLMANKTGSVLDLCTCIQMWCDREGKRVRSLHSSGRLKHYNTQITQSTWSIKRTST